MLRRFLSFVMKLSVRLFFRRVEVAGTERLAGVGPALFVVNHPNGLLDPLVVFCRSPRRMTFLAKSTLFTMPGIGAVVRAFDAVPVFRRQDVGSATDKHSVTFSQARAHMRHGVAVCIFPEGVSHSDPQLRPIKTGAARIALGAELEGLHVVPVGLYYLSKMSFRSSALLYFGEPIAVSPSGLVDAEPPHEAVDALTAQIRQALEKVTLGADSQQAIALCERAERIFRAASEEDITGDDLLKERFELRQRLLEGYAMLRRERPGELERVTMRVDRYMAEVEALNLTPEHLAPHEFKTAQSAKYAAFNGLVLLLLLLPALCGFLTHYLTYRVLGTVAKPIAAKDKEGGDDMIATVKVFGGMLLFPLTWLIIALVVGLTVGWWTAVLSLALLPASGWCALVFTEWAERVGSATRALFALSGSKGTLARLHAERVAIADEIRRLGEKLTDRL